MGSLQQMAQAARLGPWAVVAGCTCASAAAASGGGESGGGGGAAALPDLAAPRFAAAVLALGCGAVEGTAACPEGGEALPPPSPLAGVVAAAKCIPEPPPLLAPAGVGCGSELGEGGLNKLWRRAE